MWYLIPVILYLLYKLSMHPYSYWEKKGVPSRKPYPFLGNFAGVVLQTKPFYDLMKNATKGFENHRYFGGYQFYNRNLVVHDPELLKQILVKDFDHFTDHRRPENEHIEPIFNKNIFRLNGERWRDMRSVLSPAFTSSKMKGMFHLMVECAKNVPKFLDKVEGDEIQIKDLFARYTNDVIATCAFGVTCNSLLDKENEFYLIGKEALNIQRWRTIKMMIMTFSPTLFKLFKPEVFPRVVQNVFFNTIKESIVYRSQHDIIKPDMIHLLLEARKGQLNPDVSTPKRDLNCNFTDMDIAAHAFIFFFAGLDATSTILSMIAIELAHNEDVQDKLRAEIDEMMNRTGGNPSYDDIVEMKYMDMCVSESLRKWPPAAMTDRLCSKDYLIKAERPHEKDLLIDTSVTISIPILAIQRDERYFPNPEKFDPERFSKENKHKIIPFTYLPFGVGPRGCIGTRFALLKIKILVAFLLHSFELCKSSKLTMPLEFKVKGVKIEPVNGFYLKIKARNGKKKN